MALLDYPMNLDKAKLRLQIAISPTQKNKIKLKPKDIKSLSSLQCKNNKPTITVKRKTLIVFPKMMKNLTLNLKIYSNYLIKANYHFNKQINSCRINIGDMGPL